MTYKRFVVTGTDTHIGKTIFAAALTRALNACYWKPVQAGVEKETDSETVMRLAGVPAEQILLEQWRLRMPASPHLAARMEGVVIDPDALHVPCVPHHLVIEGAGGLLVPLTDNHLLIDVFARWQLPVILCARTTLGTINHTLLSLEALHRRNIPVHGVAFIGDEQAENRKMITTMGQVRDLGRLPFLSPLIPSALYDAFTYNFGNSL